MTVPAFRPSFPLTHAEAFGHDVYMRRRGEEGFGAYTPEKIRGRLVHRLTFWVDGKRYRIGSAPMPGGGRIRIDSADMARDCLRHIRSRIRAGDSPMQAIAPFLARAAPENQHTTWLQRWIAQVADQVAAGDRSPTYLRELRRYVKPSGHFSFWEGVAVWEIRYRQLEDWNTWLSRRGISPKTRRNVLGAFQAYMRWLERLEVVFYVPEFPRVPLEEHTPRLLEPEQQARVLGAIPLELRGIFLALARLGLRPGEARAADLEDYRDGWLTVCRAVKGGAASAPIRGTKTRRSRRLPVSHLAPDLEDWIREYTGAGRALREVGRPLFENPRARNEGRRWSHWALHDEWKRACREVGIEGALYESTRHSFATNLLTRGVAEEVVQHLLGHADPRTTKRYGKLLDQAVLTALTDRRDA